MGLIIDFFIVKITLLKRLLHSNAIEQWFSTGCPKLTFKGALRGLIFLNDTK